MSENVQTQPAPESAPEQTQEANLEAEAQESEERQSSVEGESNSEAELQEAVESAVANGASKEEVKNMIRKFKLKVDGKEVEREIDLSDEEFLKNQLQLAEVSRKRMQENAEMKKLFEQEIGRLQNKEELWKVMQELGHNPDDLVREYMEERIKEQEMSPEEKERIKLQKEIEEYRKKEKELREQAEKAQMSKLEQEAAMQLDEEIDQALSANTSLPKTPFVVKRIADTLLWAINNGHKDATVEDVVPVVENEISREMGDYFDSLPEEALERVVRKKNLERLRKKRLDRSKSKPKTLSSVNEVTKDKKSSDTPKEEKHISINDFLGKKGRVRS